MSELMTQKEILYTIKAARDSVWVIENTIEKLNNGSTASLNFKGNIQRNISHLKLVVATQEIVDSGEDISDLQEAIVMGEAKLAENIWPSEDQIL
jgi:hypothetical protein